MKKRWMAMLLTILMLFEWLPLQAFAAADQESTAVQEDLSVEGTSGLGRLLAADITEEQAEMAESTGCGVLRLEISGNTAEVELRTVTDAVLLVAIYTEDGRQLLASGKTEVCADDTEAAVTIEGEMPDYFMASAYLMSAADASPLCTPYDTPMYTRAMRALLDSTVADYTEDRVLNLDEDEETNFAVFAEETVVIEEKIGVNRVALADDDNRTYVIENADEQFMGLEADDVVAYPYEDGNILILKVASMEAEGSTVTIKGAELEMEEVFAYVKIEGESTTADAVVDDSAAMEGIEYVGLEPENDGPALFDLSGGSTTVLTHKYNIALQKNVPSEHLDLTGSINGTLKIGIPVSTKYYIARSQIHLEFRADPTVTWSFSFKGSVKGKMPLGLIHVYPVPGVAVGFSPDLVLEMEGEVVTHNVTQSTIGMVYDNKTGFQNLTTAPTTDSDTQLEAELFFGIDFGPELKVLGPIAEVSFNAVVGVNIEAENIGTGGEVQAATGPYQHSCIKCIHMELTFKVEFGAELSFLNGLVVYSAQRRTSTGALGTAYYSFDYEDFGLGSCPYVAYRVTLCVQDKNGNPISGAQTVAYGGGDWGCTNKNGVAVVYAVPRIYDITTTVGDEVISNTIAVIQPTKIIITPDGRVAVSSDGGDGTITDYLQIQGESFVDQSGGVQSSGQCGADVRWAYRKTGVLVIYGSGPMYNYSHVNGDGTHAPWKSYRNKIRSVVIQDGVTHIGDGAFYDCGVLESVHIPDSVTGLGRYAFSNCINLTDVVIPGSVGQIYAHCFAGCQSLRNVTIENGVETLAGWCFEGTALESVTIPDSVTVIMGSAFNACRQLRAVHLGSGHSGRINGAFPKCPNLEMITVATDNPYCTAADGVVVSRDGTTLIGLAPAHSGRYEVPAGIRAIGSGAFQNCEGLTEIVLPEGITVIENHTFNSCTALTTVTIPEGVTTIGHYAFQNCTALTTMYLPATIRVIGTYAMEGAGLTDVYYGGTPAQWNEVERHTLSDWGGVVIHFADETSASVLSEEEAPAETETDPETQDGVQLLSLRPGEHESTYDDGVIVRRAAFSDLMPGVDYVMLCLADMEGEDLLTADNLLYIEQGTADADGRLTFTYIQRVDTDPAYVLACGPARWRMEDAEVTVSALYADGETHLVMPEVRYDGELLTENVDYVLLGDVDYTDAGEYTVVVRGIGEYTGEAEYTYTVLERISVEAVEITFSEMTAVGGTYPVALRVQYDGIELVLGTDYTLSGDMEYSAAGDYTVTVHGMGRYSGTVECSYTVYPADGFALDVRTGEDGSIELWLAFYDALLPEGAVILMPAAAYDSVTKQMLSCDLLTLDHQTNMKDLSLHLYAGMEHEKITWKIFLLEGGSYLPGGAYLTDEIDRTK